MAVLTGGEPESCHVIALLSFACQTVAERGDVTKMFAVTLATAVRVTSNERVRVIERVDNMKRRKKEGSVDGETFSLLLRCCDKELLSALLP